MADMSDVLLAVRGGGRIGTRRAHCFIKRHTELRMRVNRAYNYQKALCEDLKIIGD